MKSPVIRSVSAACVIALSLAASLASAQSFSYGQHVGRYGAGYVGSVPYTPATAFYRSPVMPVAPVTSYYAPAMGGPVIAGQIPPNAYSSYSQVLPVVATVSSNANVSQYPPNTVFPSLGYAAPQQIYAARPVVAYSAPNMVGPNYGTVQPMVANYATPNFYRTNYARTPTTLYRPVLVMDPVTGGSNYVLQPCQGYEWQARRYETYKLFPRLHHNQQAVAANYCQQGQCGGQAAIAPSPYYVPGGTTLPGPVMGVPANTPPTLLGPPPGTIPSSAIPSTTIPPPATFSPSNTLPSNSFPNNPAPTGSFPPPSSSIPAATAPSLDPNPLNRSGPLIRGNYAPEADANCPVPPQAAIDPTLPSTEPRLMLRTPLSPIENVPVERAPESTVPDEGKTSPAVKEPATPEKEPADSVPSLNGPTNNKTEKPQATIRRETNVQPIPDPEFQNKPQSLKAPKLLVPSSKDRTARIDRETRPASYEQIVVPTSVKTLPKELPIIGDDAWRSVNP